jgi:hypothetical protein
MAPPSKIVIAGAMCVVAYDALASALALSLGFPYVWAIVGSWLIYASVGFLVSKADRAASGFKTGAVVGLADSTLGWAVSWAIGPGYVPGATWVAVVLTSLLVALTAGAVGALGALAQRQVGTRPV